MAQSVKLSNGDYIDTSGIYDMAQKATQEDLNAKTAKIGTVLMASPAAEAELAANQMTVAVSLNITEGTWLVIGLTRYCYTAYVSGSPIVWSNMSTNASDDTNIGGVPCFAIAKGAGALSLLIGAGAATGTGGKISVPASSTFTALVAIRVA